MARIERTEGIVIRCKDITETSQLVWFFTKDFGKAKVVAKGSRRRGQRYKSKFDLFSAYEIVLYRNPKTELHTMGESEILMPFTEIRTDVVKMAYASYMAELLDSLTGFDDPCNRIYSLCINVFSLLGRMKEIAFLRIIFEIKLLQYAGVFYIPDGLSKGAKAIVGKVMVTGNIGFLENLKLGKQQLDELKKAIRLVVDYSVEKRLKSLSFLEECVGLYGTNAG